MTTPHDDLRALPVPAERDDLRPPSFTRRADASVVINDPWPDEMDVTIDLLNAASFQGAHTLRRDGARLYLSVANGEAEYVITGYDRARETIRATRLSCKTWEVPPVGDPEGTSGPVVSAAWRFHKKRRMHR